jgi:hypothetical protein
VGPGYDDITEQILNLPWMDRTALIDQLEKDLGRDLSAYRILANPPVGAQHAAPLQSPASAPSLAPPAFFAFNHRQVSSAAVAGGKAIFVVKELGSPTPRWNVTAQSTVNGATLWRYQAMTQARLWGFAGSPAWTTAGPSVAVPAAAMRVDFRNSRLSKANS